MYRGEKVNRFCSFVMGKRWDEKTQTESVRIDFKTAVNSAGDSALYTDQRYLLKRASQAPASQWLYLPALRRVRIVPYQPDDPLLQSHMLFYDLTAIQGLGDYHYRFVDANEQAPVIEGTPLPTAFPLPYEKAVFQLQRRGETYLVTAIRSVARGKEKQARFSAFHEIAPGYYRPEKLVVTTAEGRTEFVFRQWAFSASEPQLLTPTHLETQPLALPATFP